MTLAVWNGTAADEASGDLTVLVSPTVTVTDKATGAQPNLFSDRAGNTGIGNPFTANADGSIEFYVAPGRYKIVADDGSGNTATWDDQLIGIGGTEAVTRNVASLTDMQALSAGEYATVYMRGRTTEGDGGEGHFRWDSSNLSTEVGNDEVTASEGDGGIYVAPASDKTGVSGAWVRQGANRTLDVRYYGASPEASGSVNHTAFQAALDAMGNRDGGDLYVDGVYTIDGQIIYPDIPSVSFVGVGRAGTGQSQVRTKLNFTHTNGPCIRIKGESSEIRNMSIFATGDRASAAAGNNYGILIEARDSANQGARNCLVEDMSVWDQPSHGYVTSGNIYRTRFISSLARDNGGHGFIFSDGTITSRSNTNRPGMMEVLSCRANGNGGNSLVAGEENTFGVHRILIENFESAGNAGDAAVRKSLHELWAHGENIEIRRCAFGTDNTRSAIRVSGRINRIINNRYIDAITPAISVENDSTLSTDGIFVDGMYVTGTSSPLDPAVEIDSAAKNIEVTSRIDKEILNLMTSGITGGVSTFEQHRSGYLYRSLQDDLLLTDDEATSIEFDGAAHGIMAIAGNVDGAEAALVHFRVGDNIFCSQMDSTPNVETTTGVLEGTTGTDGNLVISVHTDNKIYIENRTNSNRAYEVTFLSVRQSTQLA